VVILAVSPGLPRVGKKLPPRLAAGGELALGDSADWRNNLKRELGKS